MEHSWRCWQRTIHGLAGTNKQINKQPWVVSEHPKVGKRTRRGRNGGLLDEIQPDQRHVQQDEGSSNT